jgi:hypothetical protein
MLYLPCAEPVKVNTKYAPKLLEGLRDSKRPNYCLQCSSWTLVRGSCGLRGICGQQVVSYCHSYRLHARMLSEDEGEAARPASVLK